MALLLLDRLASRNVGEVGCDYYTRLVENKKFLPFKSKSINSLIKLRDPHAPEQINNTMNMFDNDYHNTISKLKAITDENNKYYHFVGFYYGDFTSNLIAHTVLLNIRGYSNATIEHIYIKNKDSYIKDRNIDIVKNIYTQIIDFIDEYLVSISQSDNIILECEDILEVSEILCDKGYELSDDSVYIKNISRVRERRNERNINN